MKHLWQQLKPRVFLVMMPQALHTWIWGFTAIVLCRSSQALSGTMGTVGVQPFSGLSIDWAQVRALAGPLKDIHRVVSKTLLRCLGCVLRVTVLLEGEHSAQSEVLSSLDQIFTLRISLYLGSIHFSLHPDQSPSPCLLKKLPQSMILPPQCLTAGMVLGR